MLATIYVNGKRVTIGELKDDVLHKKVKRSKHLFKKLNAWGIDGKYFKAVILPNKYSIHIYDEESETHYLATAEQIEKKGEWRHYKPHRAQIFLSIPYWEIRV